MALPRLERKAGVEDVVFLLSRCFAARLAWAVKACGAEDETALDEAVTVTSVSICGFSIANGLVGGEGIETCVQLLFGHIQLYSGVQNRVDRRHSSLHPDNRIAPVTTVPIGRRPSRGGKEGGRPPWERCIMGGVVHVDWRADVLSLR